MAAEANDADRIETQREQVSAEDWLPPFTMRIQLGIFTAQKRFHAGLGPRVAHISGIFLLWDTLFMEFIGSISMIAIEINRWSVDI